MAKVISNASHTIDELFGIQQNDESAGAATTTAQPFTQIPQQSQPVKYYMSRNGRLPIPTDGIVPIPAQSTRDVNFRPPSMPKQPSMPKLLHEAPIHTSENNVTSPAVTPLSNSKKGGEKTRRRRRTHKRKRSKKSRKTKSRK